MKAAPTLDGRIRVDLESAGDLMVLRAISFDARSADEGLEERLAANMGVEHDSDDWQEFVVPDLEEGFSEQLALVDAQLADLDPDGEEPLFIEKDDAEPWYGALNQARLALEDRHGFTDASPEGMDPELRSAWYRGQFYQSLQWLVLRFLMMDQKP